MDVFYAYSYGTAAWISLQALPLLVAPKAISFLLGPRGHHASDLEVYYGRFLGLVLLTLALTNLLLTGTIPLTSTISPVSADTDDPKAPYAVPVVRLTSIFHFVATVYCYTSYMSHAQTGFLLGTVGYGCLASMGLWCVMFATSGGLISKRTGADKRMAGFPFKNEKAYSTKADKRAVKGGKGEKKVK